MTPRQPYTLESIAAERARLVKDKEETAARIRLDATALFAPEPAETKMQALINNAGRAIAIYDGVMLGYKLLRQFGGLFRRKRK